MVPVAMVNVVVKDPLEPVVWMVLRGLVQPTGTALPSTCTVGSLLARLHSMTLP